MAKFSIIQYNGNLIKLDENSGGTWLLVGGEWYPLPHTKKAEGSTGNKEK